MRLGWGECEQPHVPLAVPAHERDPRATRFLSVALYTSLRMSGRTLAGGNEVSREDQTCSSGNARGRWSRFRREPGGSPGQDVDPPSSLAASEHLSLVADGAHGRGLKRAVVQDLIVSREGGLHHRQQIEGTHGITEKKPPSLGRLRLQGRGRLSGAAVLLTGQ